MKVLIFTTFTKWVPAFETDLELMQLHLDRGDEVLHLYCDGAMPACDANYDHRLHECLKCIHKREGGMSLLPGQNLISRPFYNLTAANRTELLYLQTDFVPHLARRLFDRAITSLSYKRPINNLFAEFSKNRFVGKWL